MQSESSIRVAASELDEALEAGDLGRVVSCFAEDCTVELLGIRLHGHQGVRRWFEWVFNHVERIEFSPRTISVDGDLFTEEFGVTGTLTGGRRLESHWAEILTYRDDLVTSLRLYFNPIDFAPVSGVIGRVAGPIAMRIARRAWRHSNRSAEASSQRGRAGARHSSPPHLQDEARHLLYKSLVAAPYLRPFTRIDIGATETECPCNLGIISNTPDQLFLKCTNCGVIFPSTLRMPPEEFEAATIEDKTYKCPVCANFDTYRKADLFYDRDH